MSGCDGKGVQLFLWNGASWDSKNSCIVSGSGCSATITSPSSTGTYTYGAGVDKNSDADFSDAGEWATATLTVTSVCTGNIQLEIKPTTIAPGDQVTFTGSGLSGCGGKTILFLRKLPISGETVASCTSADTGCFAFYTTSSSMEVGEHNYYAAIDKNSNSFTNDAGEESTLQTLYVNNCDQVCKGLGYMRGDCTTQTSDYFCKDGRTCIYNRRSPGDYNCGLITDCWCSNQVACDACDKASACTSTGCVPTKITTADCRTGSCSTPRYDCVYFKKDSRRQSLNNSRLEIKFL